MSVKWLHVSTHFESLQNVKTKVIPVTIGATGTISESFRKYVSNIPGKFRKQLYWALHTYFGKY